MKILSTAIVLLVWALACTAQPQVEKRVSDAPANVGNTITVKGRLGHYFENLQTGDNLVFNLRDDYDGQILIRTSPPKPTLGATYFVTGKVTQEPGHLYIDALPADVRPAYPSVRVPPPPPPYFKIFCVVVVLVLAGVGVAVSISKRAAQREAQIAAQKAKAPPIWGFLKIVGGSDSEVEYPLRFQETPIGRDVDPDNGIVCFLNDHSVSKNHAKIVRDGNLAAFVDTDSRNGSTVNGGKAVSGDRIALRTNSLISLGKNAKLKFRYKQDAAEGTMTADDIDDLENAFDMTKGTV